MANLVGRKKNQGIQDSPLMQPKQKAKPAKTPPVPNVNTYLENAATEKSKRSLSRERNSVPPPRPALVTQPPPVETHPRVSKTKDLIRRHMYYTAWQLDRTAKLAEVLMQKKSRARSEGSPKVKTSEIITRNTFIRASVDAVLSLFDNDDIEIVDNEEELKEVILGKMKIAK